MNKQTDQTKASTVPLPPGLAPMPFPFAVCANTLQVWTALGIQAGQFMYDRLEKDMKAQRAILACTSLEELLRIQSEFFAVAEQDYTVELSKMQNLARQFTVGGPPVSGTARKFDDVPV